MGKTPRRVTYYQTLVTSLLSLHSSDTDEPMDCWAIGVIRLHPHRLSVHPSH